MLEDIRTNVARIGVPTLVLSGEHDQVDTPETLRRELVPRIVGARLEIVPGSGHLSMLEAPEEVAHAIQSFIGTLP